MMLPFAKWAKFLALFEQQLCLHILCIFYIKSHKKVVSWLVIAPDKQILYLFSSSDQLILALVPWLGCLFFMECSVCALSVVIWHNTALLFICFALKGWSFTLSLKCIREEATWQKRGRRLSSENFSKGQQKKNTILHINLLFILIICYYIVRILKNALHNLHVQGDIFKLLVLF